ncbi:MAG: pilus assembly protein N-terminal domain-containing protein [Betaproteobacteria bacterium]
MSADFGRHKRLVVAIGLVTGLAIAGAVITPAHADNVTVVTVRVDEAHILKLPDRIATIVIGNPLIADATLQSGGILVITGKGYGATNLLALDRAGRVVLDKTIQVQGAPSDKLVVVYKGVARESYSCTPECAPRITLGDDPKFFADTIAQSGTRAGQAQTPAASK